MIFAVTLAEWVSGVLALRFEHYAAAVDQDSADRLRGITMASKNSKTVLLAAGAAVVTVVVLSKLGKR